MTEKTSSPLGWTLCSFYAFYFAALGGTIPYLSLYFESIGFSPKQIGILMSSLLITKIVAPNFWGYVLDRQSVKDSSFKSKTISIALILCCLIFLLLNFSENFWLIAGLMFAYSFFWNAVLPQMESVVYNYLGEKRQRYGRIRVWGSIGFIASVVSLGWFIDKLGIRVLLPTITCIFVALAVHGFFIKKTSNFTLNDNANNGSNDRVDKSSNEKISDIITPTIAIVLILGSISQMTHAPFYTFFSIYLESYGYTKSLIGWLWALGVIAEIGVFLFAHHLLVKFDILKLLLVCFAITSLRWWLLSKFPDSLLLLIFAQLLHAISFGLYHSSSSQLINAHFKGQFQVQGQALYSSVTFGIGGAIGTLTSGYLWSAFGGQVVFLLCAVVMGIATLLGMFFTVFLRPKI